MSTEIVPFGKYRGQPVEYLLADRGYVQWLLAQQWFAEKQPTIYNVITGANVEPQDSPEHNAMQARYLSHDQCLSLVCNYLRSADGMASDWQKRADALSLEQRQNLRPGDEYTLQVTSLRFEYWGWDVHANAQAVLSGHSEAVEAKCQCANQPSGFNMRFAWAHADKDCLGRLNTSNYEDLTFPQYDRISVGVELKPSIGDDFPTILRDVTKRIARYGAVDGVCVVADEIRPTTVGIDAVKRMFATRGVALWLSRELSPACVPCSCAECDPTPDKLAKARRAARPHATLDRS